MDYIILWGEKKRGEWKYTLTQLPDHGGHSDTESRDEENPCDANEPPVVS